MNFEAVRRRVIASLVLLIFFSAAAMPENNTPSVLFPIPTNDENPQHRALWFQVMDAWQRHDDKAMIGPLERLLSFPDLSEGHRFTALEFLGELYYRGGIWEDAYQAYSGADRIKPGSMTALRLAEILFLMRKEKSQVHKYLKRIVSSELATERDRETYRLLKTRFATDFLDLRRWGLSDNNISSLASDFDDLWIGTWNGSLLRYSLGSQEALLVRSGADGVQPDSVKSIGVSAHFVYIATQVSVLRFAKATESLDALPLPSAPALEKFQSLLVTGEDSLWLTTLGQGLWRWDGKSWQRQDGPWGENAMLNALGRQADREGLFIGSLDQGGFLRSEKGTLSLATMWPTQSLPQSTTFFLQDDEGLWIGSYGDGLYRWEARTKKIRKFSRETGEIPDNWVLCATKTSKGVYFGTLGGGVVLFTGLEWITYGLSTGYRLRDIVALTSVGSVVYVGTLGEGVAALDEGWDEKPLSTD